MFYDGEPVTYQDAKREGISPQSAVIYLPWKSSMNNVHRAVADAMEFDPDKYVVLSHDILTDECLPEELRDGAKTCKNEDQARYVLDVLRLGMLVFAWFNDVCGLFYVFACVYKFFV